MTVRFHDQERTLTVSVHDLLDAGMPSGHLSLEVVQRSQTRAEQGRRVHVRWQAEQQQLDPAYQPEVTVKHQLGIGAWTVTIHGRLDGLTEEDQRIVVEEVKSTALDAPRLLRTVLGDWSRYVQQLELYLWILAEARYEAPVGRLVLVSLADGCRHVLGVTLDRDRVGQVVRERLAELIELREDRLAWLEKRREATVPIPFAAWRPGQENIRQTVEDLLTRGQQALIEAPTGLGKTAAVMAGVLSHVLATDRQLFWATSRTTQQRVAEATVERFAEEGLPLRSITLSAKEKVCLNDVVACRPESCRYAERYYDKVREHQILDRLVGGSVPRERLIEAGKTFEVCPFQLATDIVSRMDVVIGDYNYAFDPAVRLRRIFGERPEDWVVVADEVHGLVERARGYGSPVVEARVAEEAAQHLADVDEVDYGPFILLAREVENAVVEARYTIVGETRGAEAVCEPSLQAWKDLADRVDEVGLDYAWLKAARPAFPEGSQDPWLQTARTVLRFSRALESAGEETVAIARAAPESLGLLCLDPSSLLRPFLRSLGGFVGVSATLKPTRFYTDLLGLDSAELLEVPSPFPPENQAVMVAPRISTAYRDRREHAPALASLVSTCIDAFPGNVAVYAPSFAMLADLTARWKTERPTLIQEPFMEEERRTEWLRRLGDRENPVVLGAVLGGIFAEGIDLPSGALDGVIIVGPGFPPIGLERDLLRETYEQRYGEGFLYSSMVPGLTRVVQAAGRLIRRPDDRGAIILIGRRFRWRQVRALLPERWDLTEPEDLHAALAEFWTGAAD